ncbi:putative glutamine amidotransferase [Lachnotalea glycerini]|uniref:Putative glutamine amidotransferase n=1 Tax=Lachnotalea glycerini TaxID=1763509 RepID=A0A318ERE8_9FIRM|nr:gamma-glutamyl-gamma-aminobutyrate hydrolase family protein [Lachnotalea glycerini]PXV93298.1 putative glutamine amidotransferase [Lachnotalea glycerini]
MKHLFPKILVAGYGTKVNNYVSALKHMNMYPTVAFSDPHSAKDSSPLILNISNDILSFDGLLLPGGGDIDPSFFHETNNGSVNIDFALDTIQFQLLDLFVGAKKPVLGICKGMQVINVYFGGTLIQDLACKKMHAWEKEDKVHSSFSIPNTFLSDLYDETFMVNSAHHQGIGNLGANIMIAQKASDYVVEAIYHKTLPIIGVQWHPERMSFDKKREDTVDGQKIFEYYNNLFLRKNSAN